MGTYDHKKLLSDWATGSITNDMATGHTLQHLGRLYEAQDQANLSRQELRQEVGQLKAKLKQARTDNRRLTRQVDQLQQEVNKLRGLNLMLLQVKDEVDSLAHRLGQEKTD